MNDEEAIRRVVEGWANARDSGDWDTLLAAFHSDGRMVTTWFEGPAAEFVARSRRAWDMGAVAHHLLGGFTVTVRGQRAIAQTRMTLCVRGMLDGVDCDAACIGRFYDFFEQRDGVWAICLRQPIYEKDRLDPVDPAARIQLDPALLARFPPGYRHLAYLQTKTGQQVAPGLPGLRGPDVEALYRRGDAWLGGAAAF